MPTLGGMILDANFDAGGYQTFFLFVTALSFIGLIAAFINYQKVQCKPGVTSRFSTRLNRDRSKTLCPQLPAAIIITEICAYPISASLGIAAIQQV